MKRVGVVLLLGIAAILVQGALNTFVSAPFTPDLGFLVVVGLGLCWRSAGSGLVLAALLGFAADLLSGSLLGEHALLRMLAFATARFASRQFNLRGPLPHAIFVAALTVANAAGIAVLGAFFRAHGAFGVGMLVDLLPHAVANALFSPLISRWLDALTNALDEEGGRRLLRLEPRSRPT